MVGLTHDSSHEDFRDLIEEFEGRWVSEIKITVVDQPFGAVGETVPVTGRFIVTSDGNALLVKALAGDESITWLVTYDAGGKRIVGLAADSLGGSEQFVFRKDESENWVRDGTGHSADGEEYSVKGTLTVSDGGDTHNWAFKVTKGGKTEESKEVWHRVSKRP